MPGGGLLYAHLMLLMPYARVRVPPCLLIFQGPGCESIIHTTGRGICLNWLLAMLVELII